MSIKRPMIINLPWVSGLVISLIGLGIVIAQVFYSAVSVYETWPIKVFISGGGLIIVSWLIEWTLIIWERWRPSGADGKSSMVANHEQCFAGGQGVITLSASMTDQQILTLIKCACTWSKGRPFQVISPQAE